MDGEVDEESCISLDGNESDGDVSDLALPPRASRARGEVDAPCRDRWRVSSVVTMESVR